MIIARKAVSAVRPPFLRSRLEQHKKEPGFKKPKRLRNSNAEGVIEQPASGAVQVRA
jgi:hypothetical protein